MEFIKNKKVQALVFVAVVVLAIILTTMLIGQQTKNRSKANRSANLSFSTLSGPVTVGQNFNLDVILDPGSGQISSVKLVIAYNPQVLQRGSTGLVPNTNVFPVIFNGPTYDQCFSTTCTMSISMSIGTDISKVVQGQSPVTIASLNFKALQATDNNGTPVTFGNGTTALSLAASDQPSENVANFNPVAVLISPVPGTSTTPGPDTTPTQGTTGSISLHFEGIDSNNNTSPHHLQRQILLSFYKTNNFNANADASLSLFVTYVSGDPNGAYTNPSFDMSAVPSGSYYVLAKTPEGSLREVLNSSQLIPIISGQNNLLSTSQDPNTVQPTLLRVGDLNNDNTVDISDYNILVDCYGNKANNTSCTGHNVTDATKGNFSDLNDNGVVDGIDYNLLIRHFGEVGF